MPSRTSDPPATYDDSTALVVVDMQNDFAAPTGNLYVQGGEEVVELVNVQVEQARAAGAAIVYTMDWHPVDTPHFAKDGGIWPVHCVQGTPGAELVAGLVVEGPVIRKGTGGEDGYSGFSVRDPVSGDAQDTELDELLRARGVSRVVVCGLALDYCVLETSLDAIRRGYRTQVLADATRAVNTHPGDGFRAAARIAAAGGTLR